MLLVPPSAYSASVLLLSRLWGQPVRLADGTILGRAVDLTARFGEASVLVERVVVGSRRRVTHLVPWWAVADYEEEQVNLVPGCTPEDWTVPRELPLAADELLLRRDVLDTQVVDLGGRRISRVADVVLDRIPDGRIQVVAADVGTGSLLRRLGLGWAAGRLPERAVPWTDLHLASGRGHAVQLEVATSAVHRLDAAGVAELMSRLDVSRAAALLRRIGPERASRALVHSHPRVGRRLVRGLRPEEVAAIQEALPPGAETDHPHLFVAPAAPAHRRYRRLAGWRRHRPGGAGPAREGRL